MTLFNQILWFKSSIESKKNNRSVNVFRRFEIRLIVGYARSGPSLASSLNDNSPAISESFILDIDPLAAQSSVGYELILRLLLQSTSVYSYGASDCVLVWLIRRFLIFGLKCLIFGVVVGLSVISVIIPDLMIWGLVEFDGIPEEPYGRLDDPGYPKSTGHLSWTRESFMSGMYRTEFRPVVGKLWSAVQTLQMRFSSLVKSKIDVLNDFVRKIQ